MTPQFPAGQFRRIARFAMLVCTCANLASAADITTTPTALNISYQAGAALPAAQNLQIASNGTPLAFSVSITGPLPYSGRWLTVSANSGTTPLALKAYVNPTGLPSGSYSATISINAPSAGTPVRNVAVNLTVGDAPATLTVSQSSLAFNFVTGGASPSPQPLVLLSSGGAVSTAIAVSGGTWLKVTPTASIQLVGTPGTVMVTVDPTGLIPGNYTGKVTFNAPTTTNKSVVVNVTLGVVAGVPTVTGLWPPGTLTGSPATMVTVSGTNFYATSIASAGSTVLPTTVLSPTALLVTIPAASLAAAGNLPITVTTPTAASPSTPATFVVYPPGPQIWATVDAASYSPNISPGELITIYGVGLGPATLTTLAGTNPIATSLGSTSVTIDGKAAPLLYVSANQIGCIAPFSLAAKVGTQVNVVVTYNAIAAATPFAVNVLAANPGLFTLDASGTGQAAVLNFVGGDFTVNGAANPALKGSTVVLYFTGFGATVCSDLPGNPCNPTATEANLVAGFVQPTATVGVTIDGLTATVSGVAAPVGGVPGVMQVNVTVPAGAKTGIVPVVVSVGAAANLVASQAKVTMAVK